MREMPQSKPGTARRPSLPVFLRLDGRRVLLVGGGPIAWAKAEKLIEAGARITMVAPAFELGSDLGLDPARLSLRQRPFRDDDLDGQHLVVAATDDPAVQRAVVAAARARGIWINVVDVPELCDFTFGASLRRGALDLVVGTDGEFPLLAQRLRDRLAGGISDRAGDALALLAAARLELRGRERADGSSAWPDYDSRRSALRDLLSEECLDAVLAGDVERVRVEILRWSERLDRSVAETNGLTAGVRR